jgi:hypothetical protein
MKNFYFIVIIIAAMVVATSSCARRANAQESVAENVAQVADTTVDEQPSNPNIDRGTMTNYEDTIAGKVYPVFLSAKGKAFVWRVSKKTGREYKQYRPEIGKRINPEAYK